MILPCAGGGRTIKAKSSITKSELCGFHALLVGILVVGGDVRGYVSQSE